MNSEVGLSIYLFKVGEEFPTMVKPFEANLIAQVMEFEAQLKYYPPLCVSHEVSDCILSSSPLAISLFFLLVYQSLSLSLSPGFSTPLFTPLAPIYKLPLVELS